MIAAARRARRAADDRLPAALRGGQPEGGRDRRSAGKIGEPRIFELGVHDAGEGREHPPRRRERGGGTLYDIGIYCINAARYLFRGGADRGLRRSAPTTARPALPRGGRDDGRRAALPRTSALATFTCSFGAADVSELPRGGHRRARCAWSRPTSTPRRWPTTCRSATSRRSEKFGKRDQFAAELLYFSDCVLRGPRAGAVGRGGPGRRAHHPRPSPLGARRPSRAPRSCSRAADAHAWSRRSSGRRCASRGSCARNRRLPREGRPAEEPCGTRERRARVIIRDGGTCHPWTP